MDMREHHFGPIASESPGEDRSVHVDLGALVRRLILFETVTIESLRLREVPSLVGAFGPEGLRELLDSGAVRIICDAMGTGQVGQSTGSQATIDPSGPLAFSPIRLVTYSAADRRQYLHDCLQEVHGAQLPYKVAKRLKAYLAPRLLDYPREAGQAGMDDTLFDLRNRRWQIWEGIRVMVRRETGMDPGPNPGPEFISEELDPGDFRIVTSLGTQLNIPDDTARQCVERGVLAVANLNQRLNLMREFDAVTGFRDDEVAFFEQKASFIWSQLDPRSQERRFDRVVTLADFPDLNGLPAGTAIRVDRLLRLRESDECRQLRKWVRNIDSETDQQIEGEFGSIRAKLASMTGGTPGRAVRFLVTTGVGQIPLVGNLAGLALSAADSFLLDRIIGKRGPATFLGRSCRSLFEDAGHT
jgi:hypothetical protein